MKNTKRNLLLICGLALVFSLALFVLSYFPGGPVGGSVLAFFMRFLLSVVPLLLVTALIVVIRIKSD